MSLFPTVRYLIVSEDVEIDPSNNKRVTIVGLLNAIRSIDQLPYPLLYRGFCVFLQLTECRGKADARIEIQHADTVQVVFKTKTRSMEFSNDPLEILGVNFRIRDLLFPQSGLYWVQLWYNDSMIAQQSLVLR